MDKKIILAIDDEPKNLYLLGELLSEYDLIACTTGEEALEVVKTEKVDLILLDIMMPQMDGYEVCQKLKLDEETKDIPVIFLTALSDKKNIEKGYALGGLDYIVKPFSPKELLLKIEKQLNSLSETIDLKKLVLKSHKMRLLLIEDNMDDMEISLKLFEKFFKNIDIAHDGEEALTLYRKNNKTYDLIICNLDLQKINGINLSKNILKINKSQNIIILTSVVDSSTLEKIIEVGVINVLYKPIQFNNFITILEKIINKIEDEELAYEKLNDIQKLNHELDALIDSFDKYVIASRTDLKGNITYASKAYELISGYSKKELLGKPHNIVRHPDMPKEAFKDMWHTIQNEKLWVGEVKNLRKDKSFYWVKASIAPYYDKNNTHIGYSAIRLDITSQKEVEVLHKEVENLLNNTGQGFLSFDSNLEIQKSFSKECLYLFGKENIEDEKIDTLLFKNNFPKNELFCYGIEKVFKSDDNDERELYLSLLPKEDSLEKKDITIEYKLLENNKVMLILTDVTQQKELTKRLEEQSAIQKMIISVVSNKNDFLELRNDYLEFLENIPYTKKMVLRELHTFKGIFSQKYLIHTPNAIHQVETLLQSCEDDYEVIKTILCQSDLKLLFEKDLQLIASILSTQFLADSHKLNIDVTMIDKLEDKIQKLKNNPTNQSINDFLEEFAKLRYISVYELLKEYIPVVKHTAQKLSKEIYPMSIVGDEKIVVSPIYKSFFKSLIHLFNNCVDHGIEDSETRLLREKDEIGSIRCHYQCKEDVLDIFIQDDGGGIDIDKLTKNAIDKGIIKFNESLIMDQNEKLMLVFADSLSTKEGTDMLSGRGMGMGTIKDEVEKLKGEIEIINNENKGVVFNFRFRGNGW